MHLVLEQALERYSTAAGRRGRRGAPAAPSPPMVRAGPGGHWQEGSCPGLPVKASSSPPWLQERTPRKAGRAPCSPGSLVRMGEGTPASGFGRSPPKHTSLGARGVSSDEVPCAVRPQLCPQPRGRAGGKGRRREPGCGGWGWGRFPVLGRNGGGEESLEEEQGAGGPWSPHEWHSPGWLVGGPAGTPTPSAAFPGAWGLWGAV